eukprot:6778382-Pyramimonas_sp.AAC.2
MRKADEPMAHVQRALLQPPPTSMRPLTVNLGPNNHVNLMRAPYAQSPHNALLRIMSPTAIGALTTNPWQ